LICRPRTHATSSSELKKGRKYVVWKRGFVESVGNALRRRMQYVAVEELLVKVEVSSQMENIFMSV
jgi:hypothetical protein